MTNLLRNTANLAMERSFEVTLLIVPQSIWQSVGFSNSIVDDGAILIATKVIWFIWRPMASTNRGSTVHPLPLTFMTLVSGSNPLKFPIFDEMGMDEWIIIIGYVSSDLDAGPCSSSICLFLVVKLEKLIANFDPVSLAMKRS